MEEKVIDFLDWIVMLNIQSYKTEEFPDYKPDGKSHFYLLRSPERFTSEELVKIYWNTAEGELLTRWNYAIAHTLEKQKVGWK